MVSTELIIPPRREPIRTYGGLHPLSNDHHQVEVTAGATIAEALEISLASTGFEWDRERFVATVNDVRVPREYWERVRPKPGTVVVFRPVATGDTSLRSLLFLGIAVAAMFIAPIIGGALVGAGAGAFFGTAAGTALIGGAITLAGAFLVNALIPIRPPQQDSAQPKTLPMISGSQNEVRPWGAVPVVLGKHRLSPMYAAMPYSFFSGEKQFMNMLFCCGYGRLAITNMRIGNTSIDPVHNNFDEVTTEVDEGNDAEQRIDLFLSDVKEEPLGLPLMSVDGFAGHTTDDDTTTISIDVLAPNGVWKYNTGNGRYENRPVTINVQYSGTGVTGWVARPDIVFTLDRDTVRKGDQWQVPSGKYTVRLAKATPDYVGEDQVADSIIWQTIRSFKTGKPVRFKKPLALIGMRARGSDQFNGIINTFNCIVHSYVNHWNGTSWVPNTLSSNPGDLFLHVLTGPANARPRTPEQIDYTSIQDWAEDCTERGYTYNAIISDQRTVREVLADIAAAGRATVALRNGKWGVSFPRDTDPVSWHFTPRNSSALKSIRTYFEMPHALRVRWIDASKDWLQTEGIVYNDKTDGTGGVHDEVSAKLYESVEFPGITNWDNIHKAARYQLAQALLRPEKHTLNADVESLRLERGDKVMVSTDTLLIGTGYGRVTVVDVPGGTVTVDSRVIMEVGKAYQIKFTLPDGTFLTRTVLNTANETDWIKLDAGDNPPIQSLQSIIASMDLMLGLKTLLEAGNLWSWPGKGQQWLDETGRGNHFTLGLDGTVGVNDPTFVGTPGAQTANEYWNFDAGDYFTLPYDVAWVNRIHQDNARFSAVFTVYIPTLSVNYWLWGNFANNQGVNVGSQFVITTNKATLFISRPGGANAYVAQSTAVISTIGWHVFAVSIDEVAHTGTLLVDGVTMALTPTYSLPATTSSTYLMQIGAAGSGAGPVPAGTRLRHAAIWVDVSLTAAQLLTIRNAIVASNDLLPPVGALFSFGERTKVTNDYRVLDVRPGPDFSAQITLVDDAPGVEFLDPVPDYDPGISIPPDPYEMAPESLTYNVSFSGSGITAKSTVQLTVQIPRVGTIQSFEFQYMDVDANGAWTPFAVVNAPYLTATKDNLEAGIYSFRVRALFRPDIGQMVGGSSKWVCSADKTATTCDIINVLSTTSPPPNIPGSLMINVMGDVTTLEWTPVTAPNVAYYRVKYNPAIDGSATWGNSTILLTTADFRAVTATRSGTYMVKAVTYSGIESEIEIQRIVVTTPAVQPNILQDLSEAPYETADHVSLGAIFPGYKYSTQVQGGVILTLAFSTNGNYVLNQGFYQFFQSIDLGAVYTSRITARVTGYGVKAGDTMDHWVTLASVVALDTTDPSSWSIEMVYAASNGPTGKKSVKQRITDLGLNSGLKLCLEASALASWPGSGQQWLDESGLGYNFFLGVDGTVGTNDPSPPSAIDSLLRSGGGNFYLDGGDFFTYNGAANQAWMNAIHQNNATFTAVVSFYIPALDTAGVGHYLLGDTTAGTQIGFQLYIYNNKVGFLVTNGSVVAYSVLSTLTIAAVGFHTIGISINEATGLGTIALDGATQALTGIVYNTPNAGAATFKMQIAAAGNNAAPLAAGWRMHAVAMWQGVALTSVDLGKIVSGIQNNDNWVFGPWTPFSVTDVTARIIIFGIRLNGSPDGSVSPAITKLGVTIDMPDRHMGYDITAAMGGSGTATSGYNIYFKPPFKVVKAVTLANYDLDTTGGEQYILSWDASHANIKFTRGGAVISKTFSLHAYGYGAVVA